MATLTPAPKFQAFDANGNPLVGGLLYSYVAGTTTPTQTYTNSSGLVANTNPVVLDARGEASVWLGSGGYKLVLHDATDSPIWSVDNIYGYATSGDLTQLTDELLSAAGSALIGYQQNTSSYVQNVESRLRKIVLATDFGATGDGITNDTEAVQAALAYVISQGGELLFPAGTYIMSDTLVIDSANRVVLRGLGKATLYWPTQGALTAAVKIAEAVSSPYLVIQNLEFKGPEDSWNAAPVNTMTGIAGNPNAIVFFGSNFQLQMIDVHIRDFKIGMRVLWQDDWDLINCYTTFCQDAFQFEYCQSFHFLRCNFINCWRAGYIFASYGTTMENCHFNGLRAAPVSEGAAITMTAGYLVIINPYLEGTCAAGFLSIGGGFNVDGDANVKIVGGYLTPSSNTAPLGNPIINVNHFSCMLQIDGVYLEGSTSTGVYGLKNWIVNTPGAVDGAPTSVMGMFADRTALTGVKQTYINDQPFGGVVVKGDNSTAYTYIGGAATNVTEPTRDGFFVFYSDQNYRGIELANNLVVGEWYTLVIAVQCDELPVLVSGWSREMIRRPTGSSFRTFVVPFKAGATTLGILAPTATKALHVGYAAVYEGMQLNAMDVEVVVNPVVYNTAAPTTRTWKVGDIVINKTPAVGQPKSWVCTVAGTPGTWVSQGNL